MLMSVRASPPPCGLCVVCVCVPLPSGFIIAALRSRVSSWLAAYLYFISDEPRDATHSLCCCVFHRYSQRANRSPVALRREKATCRGRQMRLPTALARRATPGLGRQMRREFAFPHQALALLLRVPQGELK